MRVAQSFRFKTILFRLARMRSRALSAAVAVVVLSAFALSAHCQANKPQAKGEEEQKIPPPQDLVLETGDGVQLALTYYPSFQGKQAIPIVLLHGWKQTRNEYKDLAPALQALGHAVVVPDLRGHGESTRRKDARRDERLDAATMPPSQFALMVVEDMKAVKDFLWNKNNEGELNIDKLCIVGADMGASVALDFAWYDAVGYNYGGVYYGPLKLGRFVKALVLISPEWSFRGLPLRRAAADPAVQSDISMLILAGKRDAKAMGGAKRIYKVFERFHPEPTGDDKLDKQTLFLGGLDTSLQGTKLLDPRFNLGGLIADFIYRRLVKSSESQEWSWKERKFPHE
ncbi:MAG: alpha/beta fold hydrolase [Pirellulales bacterium]|nr:alpha/beta fold hydrolase [Pirellulales bacterium]